MSDKTCGECEYYEDRKGECYGICILADPKFAVHPDQPVCPDVILSLASARAEVERLCGAIETLTRDGVRQDEEIDRLRRELGASTKLFEMELNKRRCLDDRAEAADARVKELEAALRARMEDVCFKIPDDCDCEVCLATERQARSILDGNGDTDAD